MPATPPAQLVAEAAEILAGWPITVAAMLTDHRREADVCLWGRPHPHPDGCSVLRLAHSAQLIIERRRRSECRAERRRLAALARASLPVRLAS